MAVHSREIIQLVEYWAPIFISYGAVAFAVALALRLILALFRKRSGLLRIVSWLGGIAFVGGIASVWIVTGNMPDVPGILTDIWRNSSKYVPANINDVNAPGLITLCAGVFLSIFAGPISFMFGSSKDREGVHDAEIVIRTIGWLVVVVGALMAMNILSFVG